MHIACSANISYLPHAAAMLHSLLGHHGGDAPTIHFLHDPTLSGDDIEKLGAFVSRLGGVWRPHPIDRELLAGFPENWRFSREAWFRVLLPEILPQVSRVLYLDADTLIMRPLTELLATDLQGRTVGAVANPLYPFMDDSFIRELGLNSPDDYFNSGVLLMDLDRWREQGLTEMLRAFIVEHGQAQVWPDQNALNAVLHGRWHALAPKWNAQNIYFDLKPADLPYSANAVLQARKEPTILHFVAPYKPWDYLCKHPYRQAYFEHRGATPWPRVAVRDATWGNRLLRLLPQPFMWLWLRRLRNGWRSLRARLRAFARPRS